MIWFTLRRLALAVPTLLLLLTAIFVLVRLVPGDPAAVILGDQASQSALTALRAKLASISRSPSSTPSSSVTC